MSITNYQVTAAAYCTIIIYPVGDLTKVNSTSKGVGMTSLKINVHHLNMTTANAVFQIRV